MRTKISKANAHFAALNLFISKKGFNESFTLSVNHEDLDVDINFVNEGDEETESYRRRGF